MTYQSPYLPTELIMALEQNKTFLLQEIRNSEKENQPAHALMAFLLEHKIHLALVPNEYGGFGLGPVGEMQLIRAATKLDPSLGWIIFQLCGNVGRVLSFSKDSDIKHLMAEQNGHLVFCYQNNFLPGKLSKNKGSYHLSGEWMASLSKYASHFVLPYVAPDQSKRCMIVPQNACSILSTSIGIGLRATSTTQFEISDFPVSNALYDIAAESSNRHFLPFYTAIRAPIKHTAWTLGVGDKIMGIRNKFSLDNTEAHDLFQRAGLAFTKVIEAYEMKLLGTKAQNINISDLYEKTKALHHWLLELAMATYLALPKEAMNPTSPLSCLILDMMTMSHHIELREKTIKTWGQNNSLQTDQLRKHL